MSMLRRIWLALVGVLATVLGVMGVLSVLQHDAVLSRLIQERLAVIAETTAASFRPVIDLGLPISTIRNADDVLRGAMDIDSTASGITVFHQTGVVVHATGVATREPVGRDILLAQSLSTSDRWAARRGDELVSGVTLRATSGASIGGILVSADSAGFEARSRDMTYRIAAATTVVFLLFSALTLMVLRLWLGGVIRGLERLERLSDGFSRDPVGLHGTSTVVPAPDYGFLSAEIVRLEEQLGNAYGNFRAAWRKLAGLAGGEPLAEDRSALDASAPRTALALVPGASLSNTLARALTPWVAALILGSTLALGAFVHGEVKRSFEPEFASRTELIGAVANRTVQRVVDAGVPLTQLVGAESYFDDLLAHFPEVSYFGVATGRIVYEAGARQNTLFAPARARKDVPTFPITAGDEQIGYIIVDANPEYFALQFRDMLLDFGVLVLVVMLLAFQIMTLVMSRSLTAPFMQLQHLAGLQAAGDFSKVIATEGTTAIDRLGRTLSDYAVHLQTAYAAVARRLGPTGRASELRELGARFHLRGGQPDRLQFSYLNDVRLPLFLFAAADELPLAFFPLFTRGAENPFTWLDAGVVISLPLAGYLVAIVFGSPLARPLADRWGHRRLLLLAIAPAVIGHVGLYFSTSVVEIILYRSLAGFGYAIVTLTCQDYVLDVVAPGERHRALGLFTAAMFSGIFAGTALGGVLADRLGQDTVFAVSAALVVISGLLTYRLIPPRPASDPARAGASGAYFPPIWRPLASARFSALVFGLAVPANIVLQGFICFLVALHLDALGASPAGIGRILMTYFLAIIFVCPVAPHLLERRLDATGLGLIGAVISGVSLCAIAIWPSQLAMLIAVAGAGIGHGLVRDTQVAVAMEIAERELAHLGPGAVLGALRTLERLGSIAGLVLIALLASLFGYAAAIGALAGVVFAGAAGLALTAMALRISSRSRRSEGSPPADRG